MAAASSMHYCHGFSDTHFPEYNLAVSKEKAFWQGMDVVE